MQRQYRDERSCVGWAARRRQGRGWEWEAAQHHIHLHPFTRYKSSARAGGSVMTAFVAPRLICFLFIKTALAFATRTLSDTRREWIFDVMESENPNQRDETGGVTLQQHASQSDQH